MKKLGTNESRVENIDVASPVEDIPGETGVSVLLPDLDPQRTYKVMSPRLAAPEQAKDFVKLLVEETPEGDR